MTNAGEGNLTAAEPDTAEAGPTIMVPLLNPRTETALITLASILARQQGGRVLATHIVTVPDQTSLQVAAQNRDQIDAESEQLLQAATADAEEFDVPIETLTILSHRGLDEVFDAARDHDADTIVMGYGGARFAGGRAEGALDELTHDLPCDVLVLDAESFDPSTVLLPTRGGRSSELSADVARALQELAAASISLLHVVDPGEEPAGREFLAEWATENGLEDAEVHIETGTPGAVISSLGREYDLVLLGATERGLLSRIVRRSPALRSLESLDVPVLLAERPTSRSLWERLGRWR